MISIPSTYHCHHFLFLFSYWTRNLYHYSSEDFLDEVMTIVNKRAEDVLTCGFYFLGTSKWETCPEESMLGDYIKYPNCFLKGTHPFTREDGCPQHCGLPMR